MFRGGINNGRSQKLPVSLQSACYQMFLCTRIHLTSAWNSIPPCSLRFLSCVYCSLFHFGRVSDKNGSMQETPRANKEVNGSLSPREEGSIKQMAAFNTACFKCPACSLKIKLWLYQWGDPDIQDLMLPVYWCYQPFITILTSLWPHDSSLVRNGSATVEQNHTSSFLFFHNLASYLVIKAGVLKPQHLNVLWPTLCSD